MQFFKFSIDRQSFIYSIILSNLAFAVPIGISVMLMFQAETTDIDFGKKELVGITYLRPLSKLLVEVSRHHLIYMRHLSRSSSHLPGSLREEYDEIKAVELKIDGLFNDLDATSRRYAEQLEFTSEGLLKRKRQLFTAENMRSKWEILKSIISKGSPSGIQSVHYSLISGIKAMMNHAGDTSNLILDPDLDSYYMMEVSIKHVPNLIEMVQKIPTLVLTAHQSAADTNKKQEALTELPLLTQFKASSRTLYTIYAYIIDNIYLAGINFDVGTALNEDQNFHGTSKSLQEKLPKQTEILMSKLQIYTDLVREIGVSTQLDSFKLAQASEQALRSAEEFWQISYEELEKLLKIRIDDLSTSRSLCILWTLISIALAVLMDVIVIRKFKSIEDEKENQRQIIEQQRGNLESSARLSSLGEMAGGIAHEINNPLAVIAGTASQLQRLARKGNLPTEFIVTHSVTIMETADRIGKIVTGLRTFARDGKHDQLVPTSLQKVIDQTVGFSESRFRDRGIALRVEIPSDLPLVDCRGVQISQVVLNLLNNAFDAVVDAKDPFILLKIEERGSDIEISVTDNGSGVAPELRDKIMQPFFTTKEVGKGTGLGLSITSGIIKAHDGAFFLDPNSRLTRFVIRIPKTQKKDHLRVRDVA